MKYLIFLLSLLTCLQSNCQDIDFEKLKKQQLEAEEQGVKLLSMLIDTTKAQKAFFSEWDREVDYYVGDVVSYNNTAYESLADGNKEVPNKSKFWKKAWDKTITIEGVVLRSRLFLRVDSIYAKLKRKFPYAIDSQGNLMAGADRIVFNNCELSQLPINDIAIDYSLTFNQSKINFLYIENIKVPELTILDNSIDNIEIIDSEINNLLIRDLRKSDALLDDQASLYIHNSIINSAYLGSTPEKFNIGIHESKFPGDTTFYPYNTNNKNSDVFKFVGAVNNGASALTIFKSVFGSPNDSTSMFLKGNFSTIEIDSAIFHSNLSLFSIVQERIHLTDNTFNGMVSINNATLPIDFKIRWSQLMGRRIAKFRDIQAYDPFSGTFRPVQYMKPSNGEGISDIDHYEDIMRSYQTLYMFYKNAGDIESANGCFSEMKDIQTERLAYLFTQERTFKSYFRWKLTVLMKFYTDHGTDPARALVISIWVILAFAVFYFFFPSDWDVTSKSKLIQNYKDFIEKNEKGYVKPFMALTIGFIVSLLNAITLSVNSFTTLGFGNIPTHGIAKYFCVLQGFIGWFLLSIFTVALINQVLG